MFTRLSGLKALIIGLLALAFLIALFIIALNIFLILLPIVLVLVVVAYLFGKLSWWKKKPSKAAAPKAYVDVKYKVKE